MRGQRVRLHGRERDVNEVRNYWNAHLHDAAASDSAVGSPAFFRDLEEFRFTKLEYLPSRVDFAGYAGKEVLEIGCGLGIDLHRFARGGASVTGVDLAESPLRLAQKHFDQSALPGAFQLADGGKLPFRNESFDLVYCHGVLQYAPIFLIVISLVITVHELGHYWVGRMFGAAAESFAIDFGRPIFQMKDKRGTRWRINWPRPAASAASITSARSTSRTGVAPASRCCGASRRSSPVPARTAT